MYTMMAAMKRLLAVLAILLPLALTVSDTVVAAAPGTPIYLDRSYSPQERAADLVSRMTLAEKASQMISSRATAIPRLGVASYGWWNEAAHGVAREQTNDGDNPPDLTNTTSYPVSLSLGATWNPDLVYREASLISDEARDVMKDNRYDLDFYSPTVNLSRDPRWGRNDETFGEDPLLTAALAAQYVNGLQGQTEQGEVQNGYLKAIATLKHFAANNSESNRLNGSSDMDERTLREFYTAQFRDAIKWSHPGAIMSAYNSVNDVPSAANGHLINTLARQTYGFDGYFTSDCDAVFEIQAGQNWQQLDQFGRTAFAQSAGEDLNCDMGYHDEWNYANTIPTAVQKGIRTPTGVYNENDVDVSVVRLFAARIALGEFDAEGRVPWVAQARKRLAPGTWKSNDTNDAVTQTPDRLAMARKVADESIVLLKNDNTTLPLKAPNTVVVMGPCADPAAMYLGGYSSNQGSAGTAKSVTPYQGLKAALGTVDFRPGIVPGAEDSVDPAAIEAAARYDTAIVCAGTDDATASEDHDRTDLALPAPQVELINRVAAANPHTIVYLETVGPVDLRPIKANAILWSSYNGQQQGAALADVVTGAVAPSGRLPFTWYADENELSTVEDYTIRPTAASHGRTYQYFTGHVTYPFGYGLSYNSFRYTGMVLNGTQVTATVTNTGDRTAADVVQLYATTPDAPATAQRPRKRLVGFQKVTLAPHASTPVTVPFSLDDLAFFDEKADRFELDPGRYGLQLATSSAESDIIQQVYLPEPGHLAVSPAVVTAKPVVVGDAARGIAQRLRFPKGSRIDPQLTVAMTDETLYHKLPSGMTVRYESNRPAVVAVDGAGLLARHSGVATITATVTYEGATVSRSFVISVYVV
jgi:beta-glucosidase